MLPAVPGANFATSRTTTKYPTKIVTARNTRRSGGGPSGSLGSKTPAWTSPAWVWSGVGMDSETVLM